MRAADQQETLLIPERFNGPPQSSNGGYLCGAVAHLLGAAAAEIALRSPPPLETPLSVVRDDGAARLLDGDTLVAEGRALPALDLEVPDPVSGEEAREASERFPWYHEGHAFPTCFVCGPQRTERDGLALFAGPSEDRRVYACEWTPAAEWSDGSGSALTEIVWAALDCPTAVPAAELAGRQADPAVLAQLAASVEAPVRVDESHAVVSWPIGHEGRKRRAGSAIFGPDGRTRARARALWIEVRS